ncbi:hypothetical protein EOL96_02185 [Candidatus Saccharibacteria bacterium]|nr:hypothetical protein [Candidatus Saccharibacteria bacterium]
MYNYMLANTRTIDVYEGIVMNFVGNLIDWFSSLDGWTAFVLYTLGSVLFGSINKRPQRWRCFGDSGCERWFRLENGCSHAFSAVGGYMLWPLLLPATVIYILVESHPSQWSFRKKSTQR